MQQTAPPPTQLFQIVILWHAVARVLLKGGSKRLLLSGVNSMNLNTTILREISFQLTQGNPWWGMLLANEYLDETNPLRSAFILRFKQSISEASAEHGSLANALIRGKRRNKLSAKQLALVGSRVMPRTRTATPPAISALGRSRRAVPTTYRAASTARLALRQRHAHAARFSSSARVAAIRDTKTATAQLVAI